MTGKHGLWGMALAAATAVATAGPAGAQDARAAAVLMVEDEGYPGSALTERLGTTLYGRFLGEGPYAKVQTLVGRGRANERLAAAIVALAGTHDVIDVFCSIHTTTRDPAAWARALAPARGKLRLVYSTACYGNDEERAAWEALEPQAVVTHVGINNPVVALPYVLSGWLAGRPLGALVTEAYRETTLASSFLLSLPGMAGTRDLVPSVDGSRPVLTGDRALTIRSGAPRARVGVPQDLRYDRAKGGPIGLALRALAGRFSVDGGEVRGLFERVSLPPVLPAAALEQVERVSVESARGQGLVALALRGRVEVPFEGAKLRVEPRATLTPGRADVTTRSIEVRTTGLSIRKGILRVRLDRLRLWPNPNGRGYLARAHAGLWGFIPVWKTFDVGGTAPGPIADVGPIFRAMPRSRGLVDALTRR